MYSDAIKIESLCVEARKKVGKRFKKYLVKIGHLDASLRRQFWIQHIELSETINKISKTLVESDVE